jgi:hypothetical protein
VARLRKMMLEELQHRNYSAVTPWPFELNSLGGVVNVHYLNPKLFPFFTNSIRKGGILLIETVPGCGGNYLELPKSGYIRSAFESQSTRELVQQEPGKIQRRRRGS